MAGVGKKVEDASLVVACNGWKTFFEKVLSTALQGANARLISFFNGGVL